MLRKTNFNSSSLKKYYDSKTDRYLLSTSNRMTVRCIAGGIKKCLIPKTFCKYDSGRCGEPQKTAGTSLEVIKIDTMRLHPCFN